jgi:hypothetical protein
VILSTTGNVSLAGGIDAANSMTVNPKFAGKVVIDNGSGGSADAINIGGSISAHGRGGNPGGVSIKGSSNVVVNGHITAYASATAVNYYPGGPVTILSDGPISIASNILTYSECAGAANAGTVTVVSAGGPVTIGGYVDSGRRSTAGLTYYAGSIAITGTSVTVAGKATNGYSIISENTMQGWNVAGANARLTATAGGVTVGGGFNLAGKSTNGVLTVSAAADIDIGWLDLTKATNVSFSVGATNKTIIRALSNFNTNYPASTNQFKSVNSHVYYIPDNPTNRYLQSRKFILNETYKYYLKPLLKGTIISLN